MIIDFLFGIFFLISLNQHKWALHSPNWGKRFVVISLINSSLMKIDIGCIELIVLKRSSSQQLHEIKYCIFELHLFHFNTICASFIDTLLMKAIIIRISFWFFCYAAAYTKESLPDFLYLIKREMKLFPVIELNDFNQVLMWLKQEVIYRMSFNFAILFLRKNWIRFSS